MLPDFLRFALARALQANLLVVILHVELYKTGGGESRQILPRPWPESQEITRKIWFQPRGHDFLRIFGAALATD